MVLSTAESSAPSFWSASDEDVRRFNEDGFLIVPELFSPEEAELLSKIARADPASQPGPDGTTPRMWLFSTVDAADQSDIFNAVVHSRRMVEGMMRLLGEEVYVYHYKLIMKDAGNAMPVDGTGDNAWEWHQVRDHAHLRVLVWTPLFLSGRGYLYLCVRAHACAQDYGYW